MPTAFHTPGAQTQREWIARLPSTREAERLLALPGIGLVSHDPSLPVLLTLLQWALEEMPGSDKSLAWATWEELMQLDLMGRPKAAIVALLRVDNPEQDVPEELRQASTPTEAAAAILALASELFFPRSIPLQMLPGRLQQRHQYE